MEATFDLEKFKQSREFEFCEAQYASLGSMLNGEGLRQVLKDLDIPILSFCQYSIMGNKNITEAMRESYENKDILWADAVIDMVTDMIKAYARTIVGGFIHIDSLISCINSVLKSIMRYQIRECTPYEEYVLVKLMA